MSKRRGNGEGSICQLPDGRWQGRLTVGRKANGNPIRQTVYGKTRKEAQQKLDELRRSFEKGLPIQPANTTFGDWLKEWLVNHVKLRSRLTTWENYTMIATNHIIPELGHIKMNKLQANDLQRLYRKKLENGRTDGKGGLSPRTVGLIHMVCHASLEQALKENLIPRNVAILASPPKKKKKEITPMTEAQVKHFLETIKDERYFPAFFVLIATGMRRGELLGLKWSDIDLENGTVQIRRSLVKTSTQKAQFSETKTARSRRLIPLLPSAVSELRKHKSRQETEKEAWGDGYQDTDLVFCREDGCPIYPDVLYNKLEDLLASANLPKFRVHDLRHTFATLMLQQNVHVKIVQEILGHSNISVTLDTYSHVLPGMKEKAVQSIGSVFEPEIEVMAEESERYLLVERGA